jgi:hypothetical protein
MAGLSPAELEKRNNFSLFKTRIQTRGDFTLVEGNGQKVKIDPSVAKNINSVNDLNQYKQGQSIVLPTTLKGQIRLTQLYKDSAFSGRTQNTTAAEDAEVRRIRELLEKIKEKTGSDYVNLKIGKNYKGENQCLLHIQKLNRLLQPVGQCLVIKCHLLLLLLEKLMIQS